MSGPTRNCPTDPPAMPIICVPPMYDAARRRGSFGDDRRLRPSQRKPPAPCRNRPTLAAAMLPVPNQR